MFQAQQRQSAIRRVITAGAFLLFAATSSASVAEEETEIQAAVHPSIFQFKPAAPPDDGTDKGGGWQEAKADIPISDTRSHPFKHWSCKIKISMPQRTEKDGVVSPDKAAKESAEVATKAWKKVMPRQKPGEWPVGVFCIEYRKEMETIFEKDKPTLGARVKQWT